MIMNRSENRPLIQARGLIRIYRMGPAEVVGIQDADLDISSCELVVLKGNSGSGRSTLLTLLGKLDHPTSGSLLVGGQNLAQASTVRINEYWRDMVGMIFQFFNLLPTLTVLENACFPALTAGQPLEDMRRQAKDWLTWLHLDGRLDHFPGQLSGGEMQRTAIVRALINDPTLILADEPTGNLMLWGEKMDVRGTAWMDHEFSSAPLEEDITGWDWFSIQLDDHTELMIYLLRLHSGGFSPASSGTFVKHSGEAVHLSHADFLVEALDQWKSPHSGAAYPSRWRILVKPLQMELVALPNLADQELNTRRSTRITYWEGSVSAAGRPGSNPVKGMGYVEMTGYAKPFNLTPTP